MESINTHKFKFLAGVSNSVYYIKNNLIYLYLIKTLHLYVRRKNIKIINFSNNKFIGWKFNMIDNKYPIQNINTNNNYINFNYNVNCIQINLDFHILLEPINHSTNIETMIYDKYYP